MCNDNRKPFIAKLHNVLLAPDLCDRLFSIITLNNSGNTCLFHKGYCTVYFRAKYNNAVTLPHSAQSKHAFIGKIKEMSNKINYHQGRNCFRITTSNISTQIHQIIVIWVYC